MGRNKRKRPFPTTWNPRAKPGVCKWCAEPVLKKGLSSTSQWHRACRDRFEFYYWPAVTRRAVWDRDRGVCARCGVDANAPIVQTVTRARPIPGQADARLANLEKRSGWELDHIKPLVLAEGDTDFWELSNMQTLCHACHKVKSLTDGSRRGPLKRKAKKQRSCKRTD